MHSTAAKKQIVILNEVKDLLLLFVARRNTLP
jgi:hypothetical protein